MIKETLLITRIVLAVVFAIAGMAKLVDRAGSRQSLRDFGLPAVFVAPAAWLLPVMELVCAVALLRVNWVAVGAPGALALLVLFILAIAMNLARGRRPDCHCFGQLRAAPAGWTTIGRNAALACMSAFVVWGGAGASLGDGLSALVHRNPLMLTLGFVVVSSMSVMAFGLYGLLKQNGRMLRRLDAIEEKLGIAGDAAQVAGLPVGTRTPAFSLKGLDGKVVTLDALLAERKRILLFFTEPGCGACDALLPDVAKWQREQADRLLVVPISRGDATANRAKAMAHGLRSVLIQRDHEVAEAYQAAGTPSAVLLKEGFVASMLAQGGQAVRELVATATLPEPLKKGDFVPSLRLPDLAGKPLDLATLRGRRTLLLFWNPSCGFCQQMLSDVKAWEAERPQDAPDLVVISTGSRQVNREQGFRARVLLDHKFSAGRVFGSGSTPSAVLIDEQGRLTSEVGVGAQAVVALAGVPQRFAVPA